MRCSAINFHFEHGAFRFESQNPGSCKNCGDFGSVNPNFPYALILAWVALDERLPLRGFFIISFRGGYREKKKQAKPNRDKTKKLTF